MQGSVLPVSVHSATASALHVGLVLVTILLLSFQDVRAQDRSSVVVVASPSTSQSVCPPVLCSSEPTTERRTTPVISTGVDILLGFLATRLSGRMDSYAGEPGAKASFQYKPPLEPFASTGSAPDLRLGALPYERALAPRSESPIHLQAFYQEMSTESVGSVWERRLAIAQGSYYAVTGLWPIVHMRSFEKVTGPKTDDWLVKTVGAMITVVGGTLLISGFDDGPSNELKMVAAGSAAALTIVDITYVARGRISSIYLLDAVAEVAIIVGWGLTL